MFCYSQGYKPIFTAIENNDVKYFNKWISEPLVDVDIREPLSCSTPLMYAVLFERTEFVKSLLEKGACVNHVGEFVPLSGQWSPLRLAAYKGNFQIAKMLIEHGAKVEHEYYTYTGPYMTVLMEASKQGNLDIVKLLIENGADVNFHEEHYDETSLGEACAYGNLEVVKYLIEHGAKRPFSEAFINACASGHVEIAQFFVENCHVNVNTKLPNLRLPLIVASRCGQVEMVKFLLDHGARINDKDEDRKNALFHSVARKQTEVAELLINSGADVNAADNYRRTPLMEASAQGNIKLAKLLIEKGANINSKDVQDVTAIIEASGYGDLEIVKLLIENGANINDCKIGLPTALTVAIMNGHTEIAKFLIESGADVNAFVCEFRDWDLPRRSISDLLPLNWSPLLLATDDGQLEIVKLLVEHGADVNHNRGDDVDALFLAIDRVVHGYNTDIAKYLIENGADVNAKNYRYAGTALMQATKIGNIEVVKSLIEHGADIYAKNKYGNRALDYAETFEHTEIEKLLREQETKKEQKTETIDDTDNHRGF